MSWKDKVERELLQKFHLKSRGSLPIRIRFKTIVSRQDQDILNDKFGLSFYHQPRVSMASGCCTLFQVRKLAELAFVLFIKSQLKNEKEKQSC